VIHKIGWRGLPSLALNFGEDGNCEGWLVGPPHQGLRCMFQMMNEARIMVGVNAASTASVAFHESLSYAKERKQGRALGSNPCPIVVPCHRVLAAGNKPGGFSANGGVVTKLKMLEIEGALVNHTPSLFD
jgi:hypothetical protein